MGSQRPPSHTFNWETRHVPYPQPAAQPPPHHAFGNAPERSPEGSFVSIEDHYRTVEELQVGFRESGLETSNLIVAIDFTKSNEWTGAGSFGGRCLHHVDDFYNPYQHAVSIIGRTLATFDEDHLIPAYGFGDASTADKAVFSFQPGDQPCLGLDDVLTRYQAVAKHVKLAGPTSYAAAIHQAINIVRRSGAQYHILLLIADGQVTRGVEPTGDTLSDQEQATIEAIVTASNYPLSIVMVGVGDGPWDMMQVFDDLLPERNFDNFQFVNFTELMRRNADLADDQQEAAFALAALMEIPDQYKAIQQLALLGAVTPRPQRHVTVLEPPDAKYTEPPMPSRTSSSSFTRGVSDGGGAGLAAFSSLPRPAPHAPTRTVRFSDPDTSSERRVRFAEGTADTVPSTRSATPPPPATDYAWRSPAHPTAPPAWAASAPPAAAPTHNVTPSRLPAPSPPTQFSGLGMLAHAAVPSAPTAPPVPAPWARPVPPAPAAPSYAAPPYTAPAPVPPAAHLAAAPRVSSEYPTHRVSSEYYPAPVYPDAPPSYHAPGYQPQVYRATSPAPTAPPAPAAQVPSAQPAHAHAHNVTASAQPAPSAPPRRSAELQPPAARPSAPPPPAEEDAEPLHTIFVCPITQEVMSDPVMAADGHTYERRAIEKWLRDRNSSPMTNEQLPNKTLIPNHSLRSAIMEARQRGDL